MISRILDTSVAIAWYLPERHTLPARRWREKWLRGQAIFIVPSLHYWEMANVLRTYVRRKQLQPDLARDIYEIHLEADFNVIDPPRSEVFKMAGDYDATAYDAVYIALALQEQTPLLTAERTTTPWVVKLGALVDSVRGA